MGRPEWRPANNRADGKLQMEHVRFVDQCYDYGGAYWGGPANLWHAEGWMDSLPKAPPHGVAHDEDGDKCFVRVFVRAPDRATAKKQIRERFPNVRFYR